ncbi:MAG: hypothetical protein JNM56_25420 [Planctomycetia bacterium]|nr:hypothetical protein [Planctomycetia bacterium]
MRYLKLPIGLALAGLLLAALAGRSAADEPAKAADKQPPAKGFFDVDAVYTPPEAAFASRPMGGLLGNATPGSTWQGMAFNPSSSDPGSNFYPMPQYNPAALQYQLQQQMFLQQVYTNWQNSRRPQGGGPWLPGMGSTSQGDLCLPMAHLHMKYAPMFGVPGRRGGPAPQQCFAAGTQVQLTAGASRIETVTVGQRVRSESSAQEIAPLAWRQVELQAQHRDGSRATVVLLRPLDWLAEHRVAVGGQVKLSLPRCGFEGTAEVVSVNACPTIQSGAGDVVTATIRHDAALVLDLHLEGLDQPLGVTANHRLWSADRQEFVRADELRTGEQLRGTRGDFRVQRLEPRAGSVAVYNLEVQGSQAFRVSPLGLLAEDAGSIRTKR